MKTNNPLFKGASGKLGDLHFRTRHGQTYLVKRPVRKTKLSENQKATISKFQAASRYAKSQLELPEAREMYQIGITDKKRTAHLVALTDYLNAPEVHFIETYNYDGNIGDTISVKATDDFMVTAVKVVVMGPDGTQLEAGEAEPILYRNDIWKYTATVDNSSLAGTIIRATAYDRPGNVGSLEKILKGSGEMIR